MVCRRDLSGFHKSIQFKRTDFQETHDAFRKKKCQQKSLLLLDQRLILMLYHIKNIGELQMKVSLDNFFYVISSENQERSIPFQMITTKRQKKLFLLLLAPM